MLTDGIVELMKADVIDNSQKDIHRGKIIATFCMGKKETYEFIHDHPALSSEPIDYTNDPLMIARNRHMTAINSALQIDLTGQATAESIGWRFYSGIGGQADFMRGAVLSPGGKTILTLQSTAEDGKISRIVPSLEVGGRRYPHQGRCSLCHHRMGHCLSPRKEYPGTGHGSDRHRPSEVFVPG